MNVVLVVKWLHVLSSTLLFGTGIGTAFFLFFISRTRDARVVAVVTRHVVIADWLFTAPTIVFQPLSGLWLVHAMGYALRMHWLQWTLILYILATGCWLPVVWLQMRLRDLAQQAAADGGSLPAGYWNLLGWWTALGVPALFAFLGIFYLMVAKPG